MTALMSNSVAFDATMALAAASSKTFKAVSEKYAAVFAVNVALQRQTAESNGTAGRFADKTGSSPRSVTAGRIHQCHNCQL